MFTFNNDNILTGYIKQLLHSFNLPQLKVFKSEEDAISYYNNFDGLCLIKSYDPVIAHIKNGEILKKEKYIYNKYYRNITKTLELYNNIYDYNAHIYLGDYLRFVRDYRNINLMSMYNCYSGKTYVKDGYKYLIIPVKYNSIYTVAYDSKNKAFTYLFTHKLTQDEIIDEFLDESKIHNKISRFNSPIYITSEDLKDHLENVYQLIIRIDENASENIVVLEGRYKNKPYIKYQFNFEEIVNKETKERRLAVNYNDIDLTTLLANNIQLLSHYTQSQTLPVCFADRLIEYLCETVILPDDKISKNIVDAKKKAYYKVGRANILKKNDFVFDNNLRARFVDLFDNSNTLFKNKYDILGYVDKEIEECLDSVSEVK